MWLIRLNQLSNPPKDSKAKAIGKDAQGASADGLKSDNSKIIVDPLKGRATGNA
jgi:hypothetical protein